MAYDVQLSVKVDEEIAAALQREATAQSRSKANMVRLILKDYLSEKEQA